MHAPKGADAPKWFVVDAKDQVVGRLASTIARVLIGKHKPTFTRHADTGDFVVVLNADKVTFTGSKWTKKNYYDHSGYIGGLHVTSARDMRERSPEEILRRAVWGMMNKSALADRQMKKLKLFTGDKHTHSAQNPQPLPKNILRRSGAAHQKKD